MTDVCPFDAKMAAAETVLALCAKASGLPADAIKELRLIVERDLAKPEFGAEQKRFLETMALTYRAVERLMAGTGYPIDAFPYVEDHH